MFGIVIRGAIAAMLVAGAPPTMAQGPAAKAAATGTLAPSARSAAATVDAFHSALRRGETQVAAALLANDILIFEGGGVERSRAEYESHHLGADAAFSKAVPSVLTRRSGEAHGAMAWIASEGRTTGTYKAKPIDRLTAETMVLRRVGRGWKIVQIHWSSAAPR